VEIQREWIAPVIRRDAALALLGQIVPSPAGDVRWEPVDPRGVRRARNVWLVVAATVTVLTVRLLGRWTPLLFLAIAAIGEVDARRTVQALGWKVADGALFFRHGWLWRRLSIAPLGKIQVVALLESPFDRRLEMASVEVDTAGMSQEGHHIRVPYLARATADRLAAQLAAQAGETTFKW
jgi:putative membrane protein